MTASKVEVIEERSSGPQLDGDLVTVVGAVGTAERGPVGEATLVTSWPDYVRSFGAFTPDATLPIAARMFFRHGDRPLYVVRTVHYQDVALPQSLTAFAAAGELVGGQDQEVVFIVGGKTPGAYANLITIEVGPPTNGAADRFDLRVVVDGVRAEVFPNLSRDVAHPRHAVDVVNHAASGSRYVTLARPDPFPDVDPDPQALQLAGGDDGLTDIADLDWIGSELGGTGLYALDAVRDLNVLIVPGHATPQVQHATLEYCQAHRRKQVFAVLDPPPDHGASAMVDYVRDVALLEGASDVGAIYWPEVVIDNPAPAVFGPDRTIVAAPSGAIAGVYARTDASGPGGVYESPAGIGYGDLVGVRGLATREAFDPVRRDLVAEHRVNPLSRLGGQHFVDGADGLDAGAVWPFVAQRRGVSFIIGQLRALLEFVRHRNPTEPRVDQALRRMKSFLLQQTRNGAFASQVPSEAFFVEVPADLNTPSTRQQGRVVFRVGLAMQTPAKFVVLLIGADARAIEAELADAGL